jgi:hypothetical protein
MEKEAAVGSGRTRIRTSSCAGLPGVNPTGREDFKKPLAIVKGSPPDVRRA